MERINVDLLNTSLATITADLKAHHDDNISKNSSLISILVIDSNGNLSAASMGIRHFYSLVQKEIDMIDERAAAKRTQHSTTIDQQSHSTKSKPAAQVPHHNTFGTQNHHLSHQSNVNKRNSNFNPNKTSESFINIMQDENNFGTSLMSSHDAVSNLTIRDLRRLVPQRLASSLKNEKTILIRRHAILLVLDRIRAIVMTHKLYVVVPSIGDSSEPYIALLVEYMKEWNNSTSLLNLNSGEDATNSQSNRSTTINGIQDRRRVTSGNDIRNDDDCVGGNDDVRGRSRTSFDAHALEGLFSCMETIESEQFVHLNHEARTLISSLQKGSLVTLQVEEQLRRTKNAISAMHSRVHSFDQTLEDLTDDGESIALMNLTFFRQYPEQYRLPLSQEVLARKEYIEDTLEAFVVDFKNLHFQILHLKAQISNAEDLLELRLQSSENELLIATTTLSIFLNCISIGSYVSGLFAMNLDNSQKLEDNQFNMFAWVITFCEFVTIFGTPAMFFYLRYYRGVLPETAKIDASENLRKYKQL